MRPSFTDYYRILGVHRDAEAEVIAAAYRALSRRYHPDRPSGESWADARQAKQYEINAAYEVLSDPIRRAAYDRQWDAFHRPPPPPTYQQPPRPPQAPGSSSAYPPFSRPPEPVAVPRKLSVIRRKGSWIGTSFVTLLLIRGCIALVGGNNQPTVSQPVRATAIAGATEVARSSDAVAATQPPRSTRAPTETGLSPSERSRLCSGWNEWLERTNTVFDRADAAQATYEALPVVGPQDLNSFAAEWRRIGIRITETDPPPAAQALIDAESRHAIAVADALEADANYTDSDANWAEVKRLHQRSQTERANANLTCAGYYYEE